jgi:signal transduction histidine kinase
MAEKPLSRPIECSRPHTRRSLILAALVFSILLGTTLLTFGHLVFRDMGDRMRKEVINKANARAIELAKKLEEEGQIDLYQVHRRMTTFSQYVNEILTSETYVTAVTIYDAAGRTVGYWTERGGQVFPGSQGFHQPRRLQERFLDAPTNPPAPFPGDSEPTVRVNTEERLYYAASVQVPAGNGESRKGVVEVGIDEAQLGHDIDELRNALTMKIAAGAAICVLLLLVAFAYVIRLITKTRRLEAEAQMADRLAYVGTLASGLAHEIRNPLNAMNMNLQMLDEELTAANLHQDPEAVALLASTKGEVRRLENLVTDFLSYARPMQPRFETSDLNVTVEEVVRFLRAELQQKEIALDLTLSPSLPAVELDEGQFRQALMNILINAKDVLRPGGRIAVSTFAGAKGEAVVKIEDNGPGIPAEVRDKIFDVFFSTRGGGTGLGLPIAQKILESHGGWIALETEVGKGTSFELHVPRPERAAGKASPAVAAQAR